MRPPIRKSRPSPIQPMDPREQELLDRLRASREDAAHHLPLDLLSETGRRARARSWFSCLCLAGLLLSTLLLALAALLAPEGLLP